MAPRRLYFEHVRVGDELPATAKAPIDRVQIARYACATNDFNPLYLDEPAAKSMGFPSVMAPPAMAMGFLSQFIAEWSKGARVQHVAARFTRMVWPGDTLICKGRVID
ncbi:MAG: MaoC family dehydratase N-terminal domain-containing protein, partial [Archangium sp.]|nr:MaoC family dehydratase N-terminal domain-containing protein [Archangium sp.]